MAQRSPADHCVHLCPPGRRAGRVRGGQRAFKRREHFPNNTEWGRLRPRGPALGSGCRQRARSARSPAGRELARKRRRTASLVSVRERRIPSGHGRVSPLAANAPRQAPRRIRGFRYAARARGNAGEGRTSGAGPCPKGRLRVAQGRAARSRRRRKVPTRSADDAPTRCFASAHHDEGAPCPAQEVLHSAARVLRDVLVAPPVT
jgi:hypothetical protein